MIGKGFNCPAKMTFSIIFFAISALTKKKTLQI